MNFFNIQNSDYIENHSSNERDILADLRRETELKCLNPIMLSGKVQGIFLSIISSTNKIEVTRTAPTFITNVQFYNLVLLL